MPRDTLPSVLELALEKAPSFGLPQSVSQSEGRQSATYTPGKIPYQADFNASASKYGVPVNALMALAEQESTFNPTALGQPTKYGRAKGIMQYIDSTAAGMGINPYDAAQSIDAAARQLKSRLDKGYSMQEAIQAHFGGDDRKQWGPKTRQYGVEVMGRMGKFFNGDSTTERQPSQVESAGQQPSADLNYPAAQSAMENMQQTELRDSAIRRKAILDDLNKDEADRYRPLTAEEMQQWQAEQQKKEPVKFESEQTPLDLSQVQEEQAKVGDRSLWDKTVSGAKDAGLLLMSGWNIAAQDVNELISRIPVIGKPITDAAARFDEWRLGKTQEETFKEWDRNIDKAYSPEMAESRKKAWVVEPGDELAGGKKSDGYNFGPAWSDPRAYASGLLESLPEMAITMGGSGRLAQFAYKRALAGGATREAAATAAARTATVAGGILEGGLGGAASARQTREDILKLDEQQLKDSDALKSLMDSGKTFKEARAEIAESAASKAFVLAGIGTGIFGGMGDRALAKIITGNAGRLKSALTGFIGEGLLEEVPQSALQQMSQNYAMQEAQPDTPLMKGVANQAAAGLAVGGLMGAGMGFAAPRAGRAEGGDQGSVPPADPTAEAAVQAEEQAPAPTESRDDTVAGADAGPLERALKGGAAQPSAENGNLWAGETGQIIQFQAKGIPEDTYTGTVERYNRDGSATVRGEDGTPYQLTPEDVDIVGAAPSQQQTADQAMQDAGTSQDVKDQRQADADAAQAEADKKVDAAAAQQVKDQRKEGVTAEQRAMLKDAGLSDSFISGMTRADASRMLKNADPSPASSKKEQPAQQQEEATPHQRNELRKRGATDDDVADLTRDQAGKMLKQLDDQPQEARPDRLLEDFSEAELRDRMRFLARQAQAGGWDKRLTDARRDVEKVLDAKVKARESGAEPAAAAAAESNQPKASELAAAPPADNGTAVSGSGGRAEAGRPAPGRVADAGLETGQRVADDAPGAQASADTSDTLNGADGKPKWFTSAENAQKHLDKKGLSGYRVVETQPRRFEMHRDGTLANEGTSAPATTEKAPADPRINRARKLVGSEGDTVSPSGDVGTARKGQLYEVSGILRNGLVNLRNLETGDTATVSNREMELAHGRALTWKKRADSVAETVPTAAKEQQVSGNPRSDNQDVSASQEAVNQNGDWTSFGADSGTLGIPRADMPQINAEHRGALVNFLKARGIEHMESSVPATRLKPTQAEFSPERVARAAERTEGDRSILVSRDNYVLDGHHQWLAARDAGKMVKTIRLDAKMDQLLPLAKEFPSSTVDTSSASNQAESASTPAKSEAKPEKSAPKAGKSEPEAAEGKTAAPQPSANKVFTEDAAERARKLLRSKLSQLNSGIDPEIMQAGITLAGYHIEKGARTFAAYAQAMMADLGGAVRPYLKSWYMGVKYDPRASTFDGMSGAAEVEAFDVSTLNDPTSVRDEQPGQVPVGTGVERPAAKKPRRAAKEPEDAATVPDYTGDREDFTAKAEKYLSGMMKALTGNPGSVKTDAGSGSIAPEVRVTGTDNDGVRLDLRLYSPLPAYRVGYATTENGVVLAASMSLPGETSKTSYLDVDRSPAEAAWVLQTEIDRFTQGQRNRASRQTSALDDMVSAFDSEVPNATSVRTGLEPDSQTAVDPVSVNESSNVDEPGGNDAGDAGAGRTAGTERSAQPGDNFVSEYRALAGRESGDNAVYQPDGQFRTEAGNAGSSQRAGGRGDRQAGSQPDAGRAAAVTANAHAAGAGDLSQRLAAQQAVNKRAVKPKFRDRASIDETLPLLLEKQRDDVEAVESRHAVASGILITNGTGTGKTASGLGVAKRYFDAGKSNIAVVVPTDKIAADWVRFAGNIGMPLHQLESITDNGGSGPVITTYANFGQNDALAKRDWDLIIPDESHYLSSNEAGESTEALNKLRALTGHHAGFNTYMQSRFAKQAAVRNDAYSKRNGMKESDPGYAEAEAAVEKADKAWRMLVDRERGPWEQRWAEQRDLPKVVFLSATPFAYVKSTDYAEGYLFHHAEPGERFTERTDGGYNGGDSRDQFYMQHFGYRMRYNKLTRPDADVNSELMEQNFNQHLKDTGALIGRSLDVPFDYDRKFQLIEDAAGKKLDDALRYLNEHNNGQYRKIYDAVMKSFDYQSRMFLLESMKARAAVPVIKEHLALGRKVVVFHDYNKGGGFSPFAEALKYLSKTEGGEALRPTAQELFSRPMFRIDFRGLDSALGTLTASFPDALLFNGTVSKAARRKNADLFNDDDSGKNLIVAQSDAAREGVSLHDTTGKHQRVEINLGMPTKPVAATQIEGRVYRTGQASDAIFRYMTTGTGWEASAFASKIAERASTAENLALGTDARGLKQAFVDAYGSADALTASKEDGKGGKALDRSMAADRNISPFDKAKTWYFAQQKNTKSRANREGADYYATPEPVGFKMVEWAGIRPGDKVLEPSAGHGAIARFIPPQTDVTMIEPSYDLSQRAALANGGARVVNGTFENFSRANKFDAIVMNPPYGSGGKTAVEHMAKAALHLREGGRIVALVPRGGMTDRRLASDFARVEQDSKLQLVARVKLPAATFERAGTSVATQVMVYEKNSNKDAVAPQVRDIDLSSAQNVTELFDRIENVDLPPRRQLTKDEQFRNAIDNDVVLDSWRRLSSAAREPSEANAARLGALQPEQAGYADKFTELVKKIEQTNSATNPQRVLSQLKQAEESGQYSKEGMQLAQWLVRNYPHLADSLTVQLKSGNEARPEGNYNPADRLITLFSRFSTEEGSRYNNNPTVAVHEIMHHLERMMPRDVQESITTMWADALHKRLDHYDATDKAKGKMLGDLVSGMYGDRAALNRARDAFMTGELPSEDYQYASPSEFWAENAADLIAARAGTPEATRMQKAVAAIRRIIDRVKQLLGIKTGQAHPLDQYLDSILAGDGKFKNDDVLMKVGDELYRISDSYEGDYQVPGDLPALRREPEQIPTPAEDDARVRNWWDKVGDRITDKTTDAMDKGLALIPMRPLVQELGRNMPSANEYMRLKQSMDAMRNRWHAKTDEVAQKWLKFRKADTEKNNVLMDVMHEATITGVDPTVPFDQFIDNYMAHVEAQAKLKDPNAVVTLGKERRSEMKDTWDRLNAGLQRVGLEGREVFREVRDAYSDLSTEFEKVLMSNMEKAINVRIKQAEREHRRALRQIKDEGLEGEALQEAVKEADKKLRVARTTAAWNRKARITQLRQQFESNRLAGVYFPLARFGNLFVTVRDKSTGKVLSFSRFEKAEDQRRYADAMRKQRGQEVQLGVLDNADDLRKGVDAGFVADIEDILADLPNAEKVKDEVWQRYLESLPDYSVRTNRIHRTKREGYNSDALRAFGSQMFHGSHQLARLAHTFDMEEALNATREESTKTADPVRDGKVVNEMEKRHAFVMNPTGGALVQKITQGAFIYALAASPKAAVVNLSQTAIMGVPMLAAYDGTAKGVLRATNQLNRALIDFTTGKGQAGNSKRLTPDERKALAAAYETGLIDRTQSHDLAGIGETGVEYSPARTKVMAWLAWGFHHTERLNREVTFLAAYRMAKAKGLTGDVAVRKAGDLTWKTHFDYQNTSRPRLMHNDTMKALLVFRNFTINMLYRLFRDIHQSAAGDTPEVRKEARIQLAGTTGMMMLSAGITGTWGYGALLLLAGMFMDDDKDPEAELKKNMVEALGPMMTGIILDGAPGYITGTALSDSIGMKDLWFRSPSTQLEGKAEAEYWKSQLLGAAPSMADNIIRGYQMLGKDTYRGIETMMPKAIKDPMKAYRYATDGATNLRGDTVVEDVSAADVIRQALGFTPAKLAEQYEINNAGFNLQKTIMDKRKQLMDNYWKADQAGDDAALDKLEKQIDEFSDKYPEQQITPKSLRQSAKTRERNAEDATGGMRYNRKLKDRILEDQAPSIYK